ncbi:hypothetical protein pEaSNUABM14_00316 [Erwinia phage pEa_SNUABM_14]|uniref:Uncharacterized protein n=1 Tax=Erwinia phage pEa_SNUABM_7 TaxID=2866695 RepID=A0AAE7WSL6_9CAUD|nr:hypothetical protein MPK74_gp319 [Erwinia phage pEa_SNUABM_7]QYW03616.1 hypothetical protein pEaSNUABM34_00314 [Erwinia phage pEa_SNUABM_34]QYW04641.1 hypothetical protein pEaSNUABM14_00316 [Erwinia phage pEa_SNUABM_14]QYW04987.1 hypothetical protein pEaSNUABM7_00319 [Erwinia phage pEa_SNUABM_7]
MNFNPNIIVVDRVVVMATKETTDKWAVAAKQDRDNAQFGMALLHAELQRKISSTLRNANPESMFRPEIFWADYGPLSVSGFMYIESSADEEVLNQADDRDYLCHLEAIKNIAASMGHTVVIQRVKAQFPIVDTRVPVAYA